MKSNDSEERAVACSASSVVCTQSDDQLQQNQIQIGGQPIPPTASVLVFLSASPSVFLHVRARDADHAAAAAAATGVAATLMRESRLNQRALTLWICFGRWQ